MQTCPFCAVKIVGDKRCCPLCGGPLQGNGAPELEVFPPLRSPRFTNATILRAMALFGITATIICILVNLAVGTQIWWSLFVAAGLLCIFLSAVVAIIYRRDIIQNIGWQVALVPILSILWDIGTGWLGWSLDFVLPCVLRHGTFNGSVAIAVAASPHPFFYGSFRRSQPLGPYTRRLSRFWPGTDSSALFAL